VTKINKGLAVLNFFTDTSVDWNCFLYSPWFCKYFLLFKNCSSSVSSYNTQENWNITQLWD